MLIILLCRSQSLLGNGKEIKLSLLIVFSLEMGKMFSLLLFFFFFCLTETRNDIMGMCWHGEPVVGEVRMMSQGKYREADANINSKSALLCPHQWEVPERFVP